MTQRELPAPLVPLEVDLRGYEWMPLFGDRLFKSQSWIRANPEARCAMLRLWWHAYAHELPAGSLPDDDGLLAEYAGFGSAHKQWLRQKGAALAGWRRCSDSRLYHPFLAELVMQSFEARETQRHRTVAARRKKAERGATVTDPVTDPVTTPVTDTVTGSTGQDRTGQDSSGVIPRTPFTLPAWVPAGAWDDYLTMRRRIRKPMTDRAKELACEKLHELEQQGHRAEDVLNQSIMNSWQGLFPVRGNQPGGGRQAGVEQRNADTALRWRPNER